MRGLGITTIDPAEYLGPMPGAFSGTTDPLNGPAAWAIAVLVPATGGGIAGAVLAPKRRIYGASIGALAGAVGGGAALLLLRSRK